MIHEENIEQSKIYLFNNQPVEILCYIFSFLEKGDLNKLILVSKWFHIFLHQNIPHHWKHFTFFKSDIKISEILSIERYSQLNSLTFSDIQVISTEHLRNLLALNQNALWSLNFKGEEDQDAFWASNFRGEIKTANVYECLKLFVEMTNTNLFIQHLSFEKYEIKYEESKLISELLKRNKSLQNLVLRSIYMPQGLDVIIKPLEFNQTLYRLIFFQCNINNEGAQIFADILKVNQTLKYLDLGENDIGTKGIIALAEALKINQTLQHLDIHGNDKIETPEMIMKYHRDHSYSTNIKNKRGKIIAQALKVNKSLTCINLEKTQIRTKGTIFIAEALKVNRTLQYIMLGGNFINVGGCKAIDEAAKLNQIIKVLYHGVQYPF